MEALMNNGMCRCCASEGTFKDVKSLYYWMGEAEIYAEMLSECFDVNLSNLDTSEYGGICEVCITQLRNASNFKKQVLQTEEQFKKYMDSPDKFFKAKVIKEEVTKDETELEDIVATAIDSDNASDDYPLAELDIKQEYKDEIASKSKKRTTRASASKSKKSRGDDGESSTKRTVGDKRKRRHHNESATPERHEHRVNLAIILQNSNATPFRDKTARGFSCLYCCKYFQNINDLRAHTAQQSEKDKLNKIIDYKLSYNPIKVDITDLVCHCCQTPMKDLNGLKDHLIDAHKLGINKYIKDIILPFRLGDGQEYTCVICSVAHISFKNLYHHMSTHYSNYCCQKCGAGYITIAALRKHDKTHYQGNFNCDYCPKTYTSLTKKRQHEKGVHKSGWLRNKCPQCPKMFVSYYERNEHLVKEHNTKPVVYNCNACSKTYKKKFELSRHIKHHHLQQKTYLCDMCDANFFSKRGLEDHLAKHMGGEFCACDICGKKFSRHRTLRGHMKSHTIGALYQCEVCKKNFTQKSSLKVHARLHQDDLEIFKEFDDVKHLIDQREMTLKQIADENKQKEMEEKSRQRMEQHHQQQEKEFIIM